MATKHELSALSREEIEAVAAFQERKLLDSLDEKLKTWPRGTRTKIIEKLAASNSLFADLRRSKPNSVPLGKILRILSCMDESFADFVTDTVGTEHSQDVELGFLLRELRNDAPRIAQDSRRERWDHGS